MLTERIVREAKADGQARTIWDGQVSGLGLQITPGNKKNFVLRYKVAGRKRQAILSRAGEVSLKEIRQRAGAELVRIRAGETDPMERQRQTREAPTFQDLWERFQSDYVQERLALGRMSKKTAYDYQKVGSLYLCPALGELRVAAIKRTDIERAAKRAAQYPVQRNRVLAVASRLFSLAESWELREQNSNPVKFVVRSQESARGPGALPI